MNKIWKLKKKKKGKNKIERNKITKTKEAKKAKWTKDKHNDKEKNFIGRKKIPFLFELIN